MISSLKKILAVTLLIFVCFSGAHSQGKEIIGGFSVKLNLGTLSFHGDLSSSGFNPALILRDNSKFGFGLSAMKEFNDIIAVQANYLSGYLYSNNDEMNQYFSGSLSEISFSARLNPLALNRDRKDSKINPFIEAGLGRFGFRSCRRFIDTDDIYPPCYGYESDGTTRTPRKHSLTIPLGIGLSITVNQNLAAELSHIYRITNTDLIDATVSPTSSNDSYSFTSIGLRFIIKQPEKSPEERAVSFSPFKEREPEPVDEKKEEAETPMNIYVDSKMDDVVTSGDVFSVNIRINKGGYTGPAKLVQRFPEGFDAIEASSTNGRFSFSNRTVLIEWDNMPADTMMNFTYYVRVEKGIAGSQTITGRLEYEDRDKWNTVRFNNYIFADNMIKEMRDQIEAKEEIKKEAEIKEVKEANEVIAEDKLAERQKQEQETKIGIDPLIMKEPADGVEFRIQCGAFKDSDKGGKLLAERYGITEDMREVYENGWFKYTIGSFKSYVDAVNYKNIFIQRTKLYSAFIVAYKNGQRVSNIKDAFK
jgi:hypothetical protein